MLSFVWPCSRNRARSKTSLRTASRRAISRATTSGGRVTALVRLIAGSEYTVGFSTPEKPVEGDRDGVEDRDVAVARTQPELGRFELLHEVMGVAGRDHAVRSAVHDEHGLADLLEVEAPRCGKREVVVDQALGPASPRILAQGLPANLE